MTLYAILALAAAAIATFLGLRRKAAKATARAERAEVDRDVAKGQAAVAVATHEATVIVDDRQAEAREAAAEAIATPAVANAATPADRVEAATDLLRAGHGINAATASKRAGDRVRAKIATARKRGGK